VFAALEAVEVLACLEQHQNSFVSVDKHLDYSLPFESSVNPRRDDGAGLFPETDSLDYPFCS
jgi:hypothetical protein